MGDEASITIVTRARDEASADIERITSSIDRQAMSALQLQMALTATGGALAAIGGLMGRMESPAAKMASTFLMTAGAIASTTAAIMAALPMIRTLITSLRALAITQAIVAALSGPVGWATIGIGLGVAAAASAGIYATTGGFSGGGRSSGAAQTVNFTPPVMMGSDADARRFSRRMQTIQREDTRLGR